MIRLRQALKSGNYDMTYSEEYIRENKDRINRYNIDRGEVTYDIPQVDLAINVAKTFGNSLGEVLSYAEQFQNAENLTPEENLKNWEIYNNKRAEYKDNLKRLKEQGISDIAPEDSWIQSFAANTVYHGFRQYADVRQLPLLAVGHKLGGIAGDKIMSSVGANISPAAKQAFQILSRATGEAIESGFEEYTDQLITDDEIDPETIFYSALGSFIFSGAIQTGIGAATGKFKKAKVDSTKVDTPKTETEVKTPEAQVVENMNRVTDEGIDTNLENAANIEAVAKDVAETSEVLGKSVSQESIISKVTLVQDVTVKEAREVYGPLAFKKIIEKQGFKVDDLEALKNLRKELKKNTASVIKIVDGILENQVLTEQERIALNWVKDMADNNKIKDVSFSTKAFLDNTYDSLLRQKEYQRLFPQETKGTVKKVLNKNDYEKAVGNRVKHDYKYKKKVISNKLVNDLNIPKKAKIVAVNARDIEIDGKKVLVADIEYEVNGQKYYAKAESHNGNFKGDTYSIGAKETILTKQGERLTKEDNIITREISPEDEIALNNVKKVKGVISSNEVVKSKVMKLFQEKYPEIKTERDFLEYIINNLEEGYTEIINMLSDKSLPADERGVLIYVADRLDFLFKESTRKDLVPTALKVKEKISDVLESRPTEKSNNTQRQVAINSVKKYSKNEKSKLGIVNLLKNEKEFLANEIDEILTDPNIKLTPDEEDALFWLKADLENPDIKKLRGVVTPSKERGFANNVVSVFNRYITQDKKEFLGLIKNTPDFIIEQAEDLLIREDVDLTPDEAKALIWLRDELKKAKTKVVETPKIEPIKKTLWENYLFEETEVTSDKFEELVLERPKHIGTDGSKRAVLEDLKNDLNIPDDAKVRLMDINGYRDRMDVEVPVGQNMDGQVISRKYKVKTDYNANIIWEHNGYLYYFEGSYIDGGYKGDIYKTKAYDRKLMSVIENIEEKPKTPQIEPTNPMEEVFGFPDETKTTIGEAENIAKNAAKNNIELEELKSMVKEDAAKKVSDILNLKGKPANMVAESIGVIKEFAARVKKRNHIKNIQDAITFYKNKYGIDFVVTKGKLKDGRLGETNIFQAEDGTRKFVVTISSDVTDKDVEIGVLRHEIEHLRDFVSDENFVSKAPEFEEGANIGETMDKTYKGHFKNYPDSSFELSYILNDEMENILNDAGVPNMKVIKNLGLDIPNQISKEDVTFINKATAEAKEMPMDARVDHLKKEMSKYFSLKRKLKNVLNSGLSTAQKAATMKEVLKTEITIPFAKAEEAMKNKFLHILKMDNDGDVLGPEQILDLFENNNLNATKFFFYGGEVPKELEQYSGELLRIRDGLNKIIDDLVEGGTITREDVINTLNYDNRLMLESLMDKVDIEKNATKGELDAEKLLGGEMVEDDVTGNTVPKKSIPLREKFANKNFKYFNDAFKELQIKVKNIKDPKDIIRTLKRAKKFTKGEDLRRLAIENQLDTIPEIKDFLDKHPEFLNNENPRLFDGSVASEAKLKELRIESQKENAKIFFQEDLASIKGSEKNPNKGTYAHKLSRFDLFEKRGMIDKENVSLFVESVHVEPRRVLDKMIKDVSVAGAIKQIFPNEGNKGMNAIFESLRNEYIDPTLKTKIDDVKRFITDNLGEKLGLIDKAPVTSLDRIVNGALELFNRINLMGPKAFKELYQEPLSMIRDNVGLYGGEGFFTTYKELIKSIITVMWNKEELNKINLSLGNLKDGSVPLEMYNIVSEELTDYTGYKKARIMKYGSRGDKVYYNLNKGLEKLNWYGYTQKFLKLTAHKLAANRINAISKFNSIDELIKNNTHYANRLVKSLGLEDVDLKILRELENTESFTVRNIFDKDELAEKITKKMYEDFLGEKISLEEFNLRKTNSLNKIEKLYDKITKDVSPTETTGAARSRVDRIEDPIQRNFARLTGNFKSSVQEQWGRMWKTFIQSNMTDDGKFDFTNSIYQKRMLKLMLDTGLVVTIADIMALDDDLYEDPLETISDRIDNLVDSPASILWGTLEEQMNLWALATGSNVVRRPMQLMNQVVDGEYKKATNTLIKAGINTTNYEILKKIYNQIED